MTQAKKNIDQLFQIEKSSKTELTQQQVEAIIVQLPNLPAPKSNNNFQQFFTIKNILMITIPSIITVAALTFTFNTLDSRDIANNTNIENTTQSKIQFENNSTIKSADNTPLEKNTPANFSTTIAKSPNPPTLETKVKLSPIETIHQIQPSIQEESKSIPTQNIFSKNNVDDPFVIAPQSYHIEQNLSPREARRLKRKLYKNLTADGLIASKHSLVEMELNGTTIILNGNQIPNDLLTKYQNLTHKAGSGENRKIILTSDYIRVGDFTKEGFRGIGVGKFHNEPEAIGKNTLGSVQSTKGSIGINTTKTKEDEQSLLIDAEVSELNKFVINLYKDKIGNNKRSWFNGNRKLDRDLELIHTKLYDLLQNDGLISDHKDFVVLELKEKEILFNGRALKSSTSTPIISLIQEYKIKRKTNRMIMMSHHSIAVVDYRSNSFTGTFLEIR